MKENDSHTLIVILWPASPPHHLQDVGDGVVDVALGFAIEVLCSFDNHEMGREVDPPGQSASGYQYLVRKGGGGGGGEEGEREGGRGREGGGRKGGKEGGREGRREEERWEKIFGLQRNTARAMPYALCMCT